MPSFSAVLLAGGESKRMGRDKALLPVSGHPLWRRQWRLLEELQPEEIFWSGPARPGLPGDFRIISDQVKGGGPLAGVGACLDVLRSDLLVVLAVDLPRMSAPFLCGLLARCTENGGAVARRGDFFEPLAAVYPRSLRGLAAEHLAQGRYAMHDFIAEAVQRGALRVVPLDEKDLTLFKNLNSPQDLPGA